MPNTNSLSFDGNDFGTVPDSASLDISGSLTIEAYINRTGTGAGQTLLRKEAAYLLDYQGSTDGVRFTVWIGAVAQSFASGVIPDVGTWVHVACTYDGVSQIAYKNGVAIGTRAQTGAIDTNTNNVFIGQDTSNGQFLNGTIDEVRLWNVARTAAQVSDNYRNELDGTETGFQMYLQLDEGIGTVAQDSTTNNNDMTFPATAGSQPTWSTAVPFTGPVMTGLQSKYWG